MPNRLFVEIGLHGITFTVLTDSNAFTSVVAYNFNEQENITDQLAAIFNSTSLLEQNFTKKDIIWSFPEALMVPYEYFNASATKETLELVYGDSGKKEIKTDLVYKHNFHTVYGVPVNLLNIVNNKMPYANNSHLYSLLPDIAANNGTQLLVIFYQKQLIATLVKEGKLQMIQAFAYKTGQDAAYHLLNTCERFEVSAGEIPLQLSGLIDESSNLYNELHKYFLHIGFTNLPENFEYTAALKEHPQHFFSYLFATAACV